MAESFATGTGLAGDLLTAWENNIKPGGTREANPNNNLPFSLEFSDRDLFDVLRGWPLGGAISGSAVPKTGETILRGQFISFVADNSGEVELATSPAVATPTKIMCALGSTTDKDVITSGKIPYLSTNYVVRTDQIKGSGDGQIGDFAVGAPVWAEAGLLIAVDPGTTQIVGYVRGKNTANETVEIEVQ
jgi:hypothetical protein